MVIEEEWGRPSGDGMLGFSRTLKNGKTAFSEFMRIEKQGASLIYTLYKKVAGGLAARIDGKVNGKDRAEDFPYKRVTCEAN